MSKNSNKDIKHFQYGSKKLFKLHKQTKVKTLRTYTRHSYHVDTRSVATALLMKLALEKSFIQNDILRKSKIKNRSTNNFHIQSKKTIEIPKSIERNQVN